MRLPFVDWVAGTWLRVVAPGLAVLALAACAGSKVNAPASEPKPAGTAAATPAPAAGSVVLGYSASWVDGTYPPSAYDYGALTHIARSFLIPKPDGSIGDTGGYWNPDLERLAKQHGVKLLASVGGAAENANHWLTMARDASARQRFFDGLDKLVTEHHYDGVDIDWEPSALSDADQQTFTEFMVALRARFPRWIITTALAPSDWWARHVSWKEITASVDFVNLMTYTFAGSWSGHSGHNANLFAPSSYHEQGGIDVDGGIAHLIERYGVPPEKIALGLAFYGIQFSTDKLGDPFTKDALFQGNELGLTDVAPLLESGDYRKLWDEAAHAPYLERIAGKHTVSYDDERSTLDKCTASHKRKLAGVMIWPLGGDLLRGRTPLLATVAKAFGRQATAPEQGYLQHFYGVRAREAKKLADDFQRQLADLSKLDASAAAKYGNVPKPSEISDVPPASSAALDAGLALLDQRLAQLKPAIFKLGLELEALPPSTRKGKSLSFDGPALLIADFEHGDLKHALGGSWEASFDPYKLGTTQSPTPLALAAGGKSSAHALRIWGHFGKSQSPWPYADVRASFESSDLTPFSKIRFWAKGNGKSYVVALIRSAIRDYAYPRASFVASAEWTLVELPFDGFAQPNWGRKIEAGRFDVTGISFQPGSTFNDEDYDLAVDDVALVK